MNRTWKIIRFILIMVIAIVVYGFISTDQSMLFYKQGFDYVIQLQPEQAIVAFDKAIELDGKNMLAKLYKADSLMSLKQYPKALELYEAILKNNPDMLAAAFGRSRALEKCNRKTEADQLTEDTLKKTPRSSQDLLEFGEYFYIQEKYENSEKFLTRSVQLDATNIEAYYYLGSICNAQRNFAQAIKNCSQAIRINPKYYNAYVLRGINYHTLMMFENAVNDFSSAISLNSNKAICYYLRARAYKHSQKDVLAKKDWEMVIKMDPNSEIAKDAQKQIKLLISN